MRRANVFFVVEGRPQTRIQQVVHFATKFDPVSTRAPGLSNLTCRHGEGSVHIGSLHPIQGASCALTLSRMFCISRSPGAGKEWA